MDGESVSTLLAGWPIFWLNFMLHAMALSCVVWLACRLIGNPGRRAFVAALGAAAIVVVPWISARAPAEPPRRVAAADAPATVRETRPVLPAWTIRIEEEVTPVRPVPPSGVVPAAKRFDVAGLLPGVWLAGSVVALAVFGMRQWRVHRWCASRRAVDDREWRRLRGFGLGRGKFRVTEDAMGPCVAGFFRVRVILPRELLAAGSEAELAWVVRHEAAHCHSQDSRVATCLALAKAAAWWNPVLHSLCATWAAAREQCCDAAAVGPRGDGVAYGKFLLEASGRPALAGGVWMARGSVRRMRRRLVGLMRRPGPMPGTGFKAIVIASVAGLGLLMSCSRVAKEKAAQPAAVVDDFEDEFFYPAIMKAMVSFVATPERLPESGRILGADEAREILRKIERTPGASVEKLPTFTIREVKDGMIELICENSDKNGTLFRLGLSANLAFQRSDDEAMVDFSMRHVFDPDRYEFGLPTLPPEGHLLNGDPVENTASFQGGMKNGQTAVVPFFMKEEGRWITAFVEVRAIDARGMLMDTFKGFRQIVEFDGPPLEGTVRVSGGILYLPGGVGFETLGLRNWRSPTPAPIHETMEKDLEFVDPEKFEVRIQGTMEDELERIREAVAGNSHGASWTELDAVEIDSPEERSPWKTAPQLKIKLRLCEGDRFYMRRRPYESTGSFRQWPSGPYWTTGYYDDGPNLSVVYMKVEKLTEDAPEAAEIPDPAPPKP